MGHNQQMVHDFMLKYGLSLDSHNEETRFVRARLILEEATELIIAIQENDREAIKDAIADLLYVTYGAAILYAFDADWGFERVHASNMTKGHDTGHGKLLKGPDWVPPDLRDL